MVSRSEHDLHIVGSRPQNHHFMRKTGDSATELGPKHLRQI